MSLAEVEAKCLFVQKQVFEQTMNGRRPNVFEVEKESWQGISAAGNLVINDVRYGDEYPNSFLDIWYPGRECTGKHPVVLNFHGGGFIFGSKKQGDPLTVSASDGEEYIQGFLELGFIFVNADYALAPEYRFPSQVRQLDQTIRFMLAHAKEYGFDMDNLTLTGGSAGADMTELYAMAVSDPEYAKKLELDPVLGPDGLRCVLINEAAMIMEVNAQDANMYCLLQNWLGGENPVDSEPSRLVRVADYIKGVYPPAFLIASNQGDFFRADVESMAAALEKYGLPYESFFVPRETVVLDHGFVNQFQANKYANECYQRMLAFLKKYTV